MLKNYLKIAWRTILKNKISSAINILGLSIGISACMAILIFVRYESSFDKYHSKSEHTYRVVQHNNLPDQTLYWNTTAYPLAEALRDDFPEIDLVTQTMGPITQEFGIVEGPDLNTFEETQVLYVDSFYPKTFDMEWISGNPVTALKDMHSVVLTEKLARKYFGKIEENYRSILGKTILLHGNEPLTITGIIEDVPGNSNQRFNMLIPYALFKAKNPDVSGNWSGNHQGTTFVVLQNSALKNTLESKIESWKKKYLKPEDDMRISYFLQPLADIHNDTLYGSNIGGYVMPTNTLNMLTIVALFILTIAIVNFVNILTAQSTSRSKEVGIRKIFGSNRLNLILQFIFENSIILLGSLGLSVAILNIVLGQLNENLSVIDLQLALGWNHVGLILFIGLLTLLSAAIYPALVLSAFKPIAALKNKIRFSKKDGIGIRKSLVTVQFIIVQLFVIAAIILASQMDYFKSKSMGFSSDAVVITSAPEFEKLEVYRNSLLENNEISKVSFGSGPPMAVEGLQLGTSFRLPQQSPEHALEAEIKVGDTKYLDFYDLELLSGRNFTTNKEAFDEFIVNETLLGTYGWNPREAIGKKIQINEGIATIVGVVRDFHNNSLQRDISPCIIMNWTYFQNQAFIKIDSGKPLEFIKANWEDTFASSVFRYSFLDDSIEKEYVVEQLIFNGFTILSILAIGIGCLGLFGLMSFIVARKKKEIGIRKVLGAGIPQIFSVVTGEFIGLISVAFVIAAPFVYYFGKVWLESFTYRIELSVWMFLSGGLLTLMIAMITCSFQSLRAAFANPVNSLREE
ncbi:FtsX-like permease family protein [Flavobacteriaceae bacterium TP-CH-4]|uniref:FtsX-like permease family protein n=1 Tax=Pelagihabitans pacificus TaxID=2696054 RepID=A0A967ARG5_9FLAO|nr:ABC transporter permease [Pelagihabitans pacificus]NHF58642.1 FtsX-like permease family protein [Pelagihabitans pacificus]